MSSSSRIESTLRRRSSFSFCTSTSTLGILTDVDILPGNVDRVYIMMQDKAVGKERAPRKVEAPRDPAHGKGEPLWTRTF